MNYTYFGMHHGSRMPKSHKYWKSIVADTWETTMKKHILKQNIFPIL